MFNAKLSFFEGPIDLLFYLIRKNELDIQRVPLSAVLEQYREYIVVIKEIDVNASGDFLAIASSLVEMKLTAVLDEKIAKSSGEQSDAIEVEQQDLAVQLLEYKKYCDAAALLQRRSERWQVRFPRLANDLPPRSRDLASEQIQEIELWDLVSAFGRILRGNTSAGKHQVVYDDTPIAVHMNTIHQRLQREKRLAFRSLFRYGQHKSSMVGLFLASLELVRHEFANVYQEINYGEIELSLRQSSKPLDFASLNGIT